MLKITEDLTKLIFGESIHLTDFEYKAIEYVGLLAATVGWTANQTLEAIRFMPGNGARAGTKLRLIITTLMDADRIYPIFTKYCNLSYHQIDPRKRSLPYIIRVFSIINMHDRDIDLIFGRVANDFRELLKAYRNGEIKDDST
jgi:hypothetical protein